MKQLFTYLCVILFCIFNACNSSGDDSEINWNVGTKNIELKRAGTLPDLLSAEEKHNIEGLVIIGELNGTDIKYIREMAFLSHLDLSDAKIVAGGDTFIYDYFNINIKTSDATISSYMFGGLTNLSLIILPNNTESVASSAFYRCSNLRKVSISEKNSRYTDINGVLFNKDKTYLIVFPNANSTHYNIPKGVTNINTGVFRGCSSLSSITIPESVKSIGGVAFGGCVNLKEIHSRIQVPFNIDTDVFDEVFNTCTLYIPKGTLSVYKQYDTSWSRFKNIVEE